jgi:hypothetical protein
MIGLLATFTLFSAAGFLCLRYSRFRRREVGAFAIITLIGFILWASIIIGRPLDLNQAIAWMIENTLYR